MYSDLDLFTEGVSEFIAQAFPEAEVDATRQVSPPDPRTIVTFTIPRVSAARIIVRESGISIMHPIRTGRGRKNWNGTFVQGLVIPLSDDDLLDRVIEEVSDTLNGVLGSMALLFASGRMKHDRAETSE